MSKKKNIDPDKEVEVKASPSASTLFDQSKEVASGSLVSDTERANRLIADKLKSSDSRVSAAYNALLCNANKADAARLFLIGKAGESEAAWADFNTLRAYTSSESTGGLLSLEYSKFRGDSAASALSDQISELRTEIREKNKQISLHEDDAVNKEKLAAELTSKHQHLEESVETFYISTRIHPEAHELLREHGALTKLFDENRNCNAYIISIDLRRSTELMLKAREPHLFADFITRLASELRAAVLKNYGVFDKFTGDGVLAYFPEFFTGPSAGLRAIHAARDCHVVFDELYKANRNCFSSIMMETGLGIGVDYGNVSIVKIHSDLTVVGEPVVYACRLSGANAGDTLVNQPAYERLYEEYSECLHFTESELHFKHEGKMLAYSVDLNNRHMVIDSPKWFLDIEEENSTAKEHVDENSSE